MTQNNGETHRTRRRAGRPAGPPVEDAEASEVTVKSSAVVTVAQQRAAAPADRAEETVVTEVGTEKVALTKESEAAPVVPEAPAVPEAAPAVPEAADFVARPEPAGKLGARRIVALAAAVVLVLALMVGAGSTVYLWHSNNVREDRRAEYVQAARQAVINLTTIRADSAKEDIERILSTATGKFKTEFDGRVDPFMEVVRQAKVSSTGEVVEAALVRDDENSATVLIAAKQTLTNAASAEPQTRLYRFRITVTRTDSGLSASNVEFVA
ncbi:hypothetical protein [Nocardia sp. NPDC051832]|uniref:hypothetical protein n=1 Tax=Nocardia sp. NPDC051832 TaxID=3155673 RepID=UPI0034355566